MPRWHPMFLWLRFVDQTPFSHYLFSLQHHHDNHVHIRHMGDCDKQKAVLVVNHYYQGC